MNVYNLLPLVAFSSNIALALYILYRNPGSKLNRIFSVVLFAVAVWSIGEFLSFTSATPEMSISLYTIAWSGSLLVPGALLHFFLEFTGSRIIRKRRNIPVLYFPYAFFQYIVLFMPGLLTESASITYWGYSFGRGIIYVPVVIYLLGYTIAGVLACYRFYLKSEGRVRNQARLLTIAMVFSLIGGIITDVFMLNMGFLMLPPLTTMFSTLTGAIIAYAIVRHRLMSPMRFSIRRKTATVFLLFIIVFCAVTFSLESIFSASTVEGQAKNHLETITEIKTGWIDSYLSDRESDINLLASSSSVSQAFNSKLTAEVELAKESIKQKAIDVAGQINEYISSHPRMTVKDLQNDPAFQKIAVQQVGKTGYTAVHESDTLINRFHANPDIVDVDLHTIADEFPDLFEILEKNQGGKEADGFYEWEEPDGSMKEKYTYMAIVRTGTADGMMLSAAATTYLEEYESTMKLAKEYEDYFLGFMKNYDYHDMFLVSTGGEVWWAAKGKGEIGKDLEKEPYNQTTLARAYRESSSKSEAFYGYGISDATGEALFFISVPVYMEGRLAGIIALQRGTEDIDSILEDRTGLGETGESYLIGTDYLMRSNSRFHEDSVFRLRVETENARNCLLHKILPDEEIREMHREIMITSNYMGTSVLGTHKYIPEMNLCLLVEISESEVFAPISGMQQSLLIYFIVFVILGVLVSFFVSESITRPIVKLRNAVVEIGRGKLNTKIAVKTGDEIGELASAFRKMTGNLRDSRREIEKRAEELEKSVQERTKQLDVRVKELTDTKTAILNMMEDVDKTNMELMEAQKQLKKSLAELEEVDIKKNQFISIAAHELKTPLTSIHGFSQLLLNKKVAENIKMRNNYLKIMDHETRRLANLVDDILDLSRIDMGTMKFNMEMIDINELLDSIRKEADVLIKKKGLKAEYEISKNLPKVRTDPEKLTQVLINLMNNAVKYTPRGKVTLDVSRDEGGIHFVVKDTGIGIPKNKHEKIFERFYQIDSSYTRSAGGTGLGLALCKEFIEMLGGEIWMNSEPKKGSEFHVSLPIKASLKKSAKEKARESIIRAEGASADVATSRQPTQSS
jgi:signal transduction histidine kinase